ncbi:MAG: transposase [Faecousia sp.]
MIENSSILNALIIADRGFESYNLMAHIQEMGWKFLIRIKDLHSTGIASGLPLPASPEFDEFFPLHLTKQRTAETRELLKDTTHYKFLYANASFDFLPTGGCKDDPLSLYYLPFRVVRFKISDSTYETVVTNLDADDFPPQELKRLYAMRWGIETSFRELKYTLGLLHVHAKKVEYIIQELFARLIMYNFSELITSHVLIQKCSRKYLYKANFTVAVQICRQFFLGNVSPPEVEAIISRNLSVIRSGRSSPRNIGDRRLISFTYRIA